MGGSSQGADADQRLRAALRIVLQLDPDDKQQREFESSVVKLVRESRPLPSGVAAKLAYAQVGREALERAATLLKRASKESVRLDGGAYSAVCCAHAAMPGKESEAVALALEACDKGVHLSPKAYLAALASVRSPSALKELVRGMSQAPRLRWMVAYSIAPVSSMLAIAGALGIGGDGRSVPALRSASEEEVHVALQALVMLESGAGGVSAMLQDLRASGVEVGSATRCMLLSTAMLEGWVQQKLGMRPVAHYVAHCGRSMPAFLSPLSSCSRYSRPAACASLPAPRCPSHLARRRVLPPLTRVRAALNVWLPLLSPYGEDLSEELRASLVFVETPPASGFKGAYCFDWSGDETHPVLREWMRHRALSDPRFDELSTFRGLCPVDLGVHVLEGLLLTRPSLQPGGAASQQYSLIVINFFLSLHVL